MIKIAGNIAKVGSNVLYKRVYDVVSTPLTGITNCHGIIIDEVNSALWVTSQSTVKVYSLPSLSLITTITGFNNALWFDLDYSNNRMIISDNVNFIRFCDLTTYAFGPAFNTGLGSGSLQGISLDLPNNRLFVNISSLNTVRAYAYPAFGSFTAPLTGLSLPHGSKIDTLTNRLYVSNFTASNVNYYDLTTLSLLGSLSGYTNGSGINLNREYLFVSDYGKNLINIYKRLTLELVTQIKGFNGNVGIAVSDKFRLIFVANYNNGNITKITY